ncbi:uncharacterized protein LOC120085485 isoform X2 [Benincasa hispida]|uniref:uncharacterized protein LOC120085485 isoform X2 n=1 Tax=Benincasa hispida TaxID=102211 RepID=UPI0019017B87|nr:uncharacterized protein LOC120085485 isoform X2 [Benincasa hispida]
MTSMAPTKTQLLARWRGIEEEDDTGGGVHLQPHRFQQLKEQWFADAFTYLISLPQESHIWCASWDIMGPLLETFYNYFKDESHDSPLRRLWKRISMEMNHCIQCICQHHQAKDMYSSEYESSSIGPLLDVLRRLDEERVTQYLRNINHRISQNEYDAAKDNSEVVSVVYEVLMFPVLLDDQSLFSEFGKFIESVDDIHELALDGQQQFPGAYALFFFNRRVRSVGHRLAASMGKLRMATDLEPLQPLLKKFITFLETEVLPSTSQMIRPRVQLDRLSVWLGIKSLLGFLEPPAFEEGILERYPIFLDIVLNHISSDSLEFSHAVTCLRLLFEMLGCELWLRSTLSPSVMRNTLLGQCFHTRNEKSHKDIFDLFLPFLRSLEALQDGEHEKQRRHFLYFLLHQVPVSSNFSVLTRQKACQIALQIVHRGYKMNPPCPPFECAHMWGPALVSSLKDSSLHSSLRQPAFELIQSIIVSDAAALIHSMLDSCIVALSNESNMNYNFNVAEDENILIFSPNEMDDNCWGGFSLQSHIISTEFKQWMCVPMLWIDVLVDIDPLVLPISFSKAVFWARSRFSMVESETTAECELPLRAWISSSSFEISSSLGWKVPTGSDDGGDGKESKNSLKVCTMLLPLIKTFTRLTAHFLFLLGQGELRKQWTWEPRMGESLILSLFDSTDNVRQFGKHVLEQISNTKGLSCGLEFLCSSEYSLSAVFLGMRHALKLVQMDSILVKFQNLHHLFFILRKLLQEGDSPHSALPENSSNHTDVTNTSSQGGFLRQPVFDASMLNFGKQSSKVDSKLLQRVSCLLSNAAWPSICRLLVEVEDACGFNWLHDLMDWGKSSLKVVLTYWRRAIISLLNFIKGSCCLSTTSTIRDIEHLMSLDDAAMDELTEKVAHLTILLSKNEKYNIVKTNLGSNALVLEDFPSGRKLSTSKLESSGAEDIEVPTLVKRSEAKKENIGELIVLSDDESKPFISPTRAFPSESDVGQCILDDKLAPGDESDTRADFGKSNILVIEPSKYVADRDQEINDKCSSTLALKEHASGDSKVRPATSSVLRSKDVDVKHKEIDSECILSKHVPLNDRIDLKVLSNKATGSKSKNQSCETAVSVPGYAVLKQVVSDAADDPLEIELNSVRNQKTNISKPIITVPKRRVIQLKTPVESRAVHLHRHMIGAKRFKPPRLEDWYRSILELDYFAMIGLTSVTEDKSQAVKHLKEVPVCFQSSEQYVEIFRPLILEEFKAQLRNSFVEMSSWDEMYLGRISVLSIERVDEFHLVRFAYDDNNSVASKNFAENDLILLTKELPQKSPQGAHMVGKVDRRERDNKRKMNLLIVRFYFLNGSSRLHQARKNLIERSKWHASRIMSITPQLREFQALSSIKDIPIVPTILNPKSSSIPHDESKVVDLSKLSRPLQQILKSSFNVSQLQAIDISIGSRNMKNDLELSLVQGPPGTGKTRTILAIVSALLASASQRTNLAASSLNRSLKQDNVLHADSRPQISQTVAIARAWQNAALARQLNEDKQRNLKSIDCTMKRRILICAQSNAAVDELVSRISSLGLYDSDGKMYKPYLVRVGNAKTVHPNSLPFYIDSLVDQQLAEERMSSSDVKNDLGTNSSTELRSNLEKLVDRIRYCEVKCANLRDENPEPKSSVENWMGEDEKEMSLKELESKLRKLYEQKKQIYKDISIAQAFEKKTNEEVKALKHKLRKSILREAEIVVSTLSGCGGDLYAVCAESILSCKFGSSSENTLFDAVVIDEAAQALEPATLIPLQLLKSSAIRCIMVGDPKQLPATVLSNVASKFLYECSMFERLQRAGHPVVMLTRQYRMHPEICHFPAQHFYDGKLLNGDGMSGKIAPFHETKGLGPYNFFDIVDGKELRSKSGGAFSLYNEHEADAAVELVKFFKESHPTEFSRVRIGIITPYKCQLSLLRSRFSHSFGASLIVDMEFNTVDGFQGREVDILILSTVRAVDPSSTSRKNSSGIGFVADARRMNVALTRAKLSLWVLGNSRTLQVNPDWGALLKDAKERNLVVSVKKPYDSMFKTATPRYPCPQTMTNNSRNPKHTDNVRARRHAKRSGKETFECEGKDILTQCTKTNDVDSSRYKAPVKEDAIPLVAGSIDRSSKAAKSAVRMEHGADFGSKSGKSTEKKFNMGNISQGKRKVDREKSSNFDFSERGMVDNHALQKSKTSKRLKESPQEASDPLIEGSSKEEHNDGVAISRSDNEKELIVKRKQQREAVDAILFSSLIPSKKSEMSMKHISDKKPHSLSNVRGSMKPPKGRKG